MSLTAEVIKSLNSLSCFDRIDEITPLSSGLSQTSIKVTAGCRVFFAKKLNYETARTEVSCALIGSQVSVQKDSSKDNKSQISPNVIYHDQQWLVTEFIPGSTLTDSKISKSVKITEALTLMAELHQFPVCFGQQFIPILDTKLSAERLLVNLEPPLAQQRDILNNMSKSLSATIDHFIESSGSPNTLCHGDINFTNILLDNAARAWLIDYECAHMAPVEFDLAMFIAVNNIPTEQQSNVITDYIKLNQHFRCNSYLLTYYMLYCFFINGLWYFNNTHKDAQPDQILHKLGLAQWAAFDTFAKEHRIRMPTLLNLLN